MATESEKEEANTAQQQEGPEGAGDLLKVVRLNGYTHWNITKLDVLDEEDQIPVMMSDGYQNLPGWKASTKGLTSFDELPENAKKYIQFIEEQTGVPVAFIGTGPEREEMIMKE
jgi:adenylosuccinate synthase